MIFRRRQTLKGVLSKTFRDAFKVESDGVRAPYSLTSPGCARQIATRKKARASPAAARPHAAAAHPPPAASSRRPAAAAAAPASSSRGAGAVSCSSSRAGDGEGEGALGASQPRVRSGRGIAAYEEGLQEQRDRLARLRRRLREEKAAAAAAARAAVAAARQLGRGPPAMGAPQRGSLTPSRPPAGAPAPAGTPLEIAVRADSRTALHLGGTPLGRAGDAAAAAEAAPTGAASTEAALGGAAPRAASVPSPAAEAGAAAGAARGGSLSGPSLPPLPRPGEAKELRAEPLALAGGPSARSVAQHGTADITAFAEAALKAAFAHTPATPSRPPMLAQHLPEGWRRQGAATPSRPPMLAQHLPEGWRPPDIGSGSSSSVTALEAAGGSLPSEAARVQEARAADTARPGQRVQQAERHGGQQAWQWGDQRRRDHPATQATAVASAEQTGRPDVALATPSAAGSGARPAAAEGELGAAQTTPAWVRNRAATDAATGTARHWRSPEGAAAAAAAAEGAGEQAAGWGGSRDSRHSRAAAAGGRGVSPWVAARLQLKRSKELNNRIVRLFDGVEAKLGSGKLDVDARVELVNSALSQMRAALSLSAPQQGGAGAPVPSTTEAAPGTLESNGAARWGSSGGPGGISSGISGATKLDIVNVATFMHRVSRVVAHGALSGSRDRIQYLDVFQELVRRFEGFMEARLQQDSASQAVPEAVQGPDGADTAHDASQPSKPAGSGSTYVRSLSSAMWACGNISFPLSEQQLDKMAAMAMHEYSQLQAHHLSLVMLGLYAYSHVHQPGGGRVVQVLADRAAQLPPNEYEPRTLINILCPVAAMQCQMSRPALEYFALVALAHMREFEPPQLGGLFWSLAKLWSAAGQEGLPLQGRVLQAAIVQALPQLDNFHATSLCNIMYGCGVLNYKPGKAFLDAAACRVGQQLPKYNSQSLTNLLWSWARMGYTPDWALEEGGGPTFYVLNPGDPMANAFEDERGMVWRGREAQPTSSITLPTGASYRSYDTAVLQGGDESAGSFMGLRDIMRQVALRAAERRHEDMLAAAAAEAAGAGAAAPAADAEQAAAAPPGAAAGGDMGPPQQGVDSSIMSLARRIADARARKMSQYNVVRMAEEVIAAVRARLAAAAAARPAPAAAPQAAAAAAPPLRGRRHARPRLPAKAAAAAAAAPAAGGGARMSERSVLTLMAGILHGPEAAAAGVPRPVVPPMPLATPGSYLTGVIDPASGRSRVCIDYDRTVVRSVLQSTRRTTDAAARAILGYGPPRWHGADDSRGSTRSGRGQLPPGVGPESSWRGSPVGESPEDLEAALLAGVELPGALSVLPDDSSLPDQIAAVEGPQEELACETVEEAGDGASLAAAAAQAQVLPADTASLDDADESQQQQQVAASLSSGTAARDLDLGGDAFELPTDEGAAELEGDGETAAARAAGPAAAPGGAAAEPSQAASAAGTAQPGGRREVDVSSMTPGQLRAYLDRQKDLFAAPQEALDKWAGLPRATLDQLADACLARLHHFSPQELSTLLWSYATQRHVHPPLFAAALGRAELLLDQVSQHAISIMCWSSAVLKERPPPALMRTLLDRLLELMEQQGAAVQPLCNMAWALAVFDYLDSRTFASLLRFLPSDAASLSQITKAAWCQIFQCALYLEAKEQRHYSSFLPPHVLRRAQAAWESRKARTSLHQQDVAAVLSTMGVPYQAEHSPRDKFFLIDLAVRGSDNTKLAIEVDGPHHFSANPPFRPLASTDMRNRLLAKHGWRVVSIPCDHWQQLVSLPEKVVYLHNHVLRHIDQFAKLKE